MKIAIVGAMGVGKTTLATDLSRVTEIKVLPEVARIMIEEGYELDKGVTIPIEREMLKRQVELEEAEDSFIADRGIVDILAYSTLLFGDSVLLLNDINKKLCDAEYDIIFHLAPEFPIEDDGIRSTDVDFQSKVDREVNLIVSSMNSYKLTGSKEKRLRDACKIISDYLTSTK